MEPKSFLTAYLTEILKDLPNSFGNENHDHIRFGKLKKEDRKITLRTRIEEFLLKKEFIKTTLFSKTVLNAIQFIEPLHSRIQLIYDQLADRDSGEILIKVLAFRALGYQKVKLPFNTPQYWAGIKKVQKLTDLSNTIPFSFISSGINGKLSYFDLTPIGIPVAQYSFGVVLFNEYIAEQYKCTSDQATIGVEAGDTVIDVGGCWGGTSLYFAHHAGPEGKVISFEFAPGNLDIFSRNLDLNPQLKDRIAIVERAAWSSSNISLHFEDDGPSTRMVMDDGNQNVSVETLSIDDLVESQAIPRVDFIKMDIEGSELQALQGATHTIKRDRPEMAICIYHKLEDFVEIPEFILSLNLGYSIYIRHFTIYEAETVLFAKVT